jgi:hypothetical protein
MGTTQISAELIKAEDETLCSETHKFIFSTENKEELPQQWKEYIILPIHNYLQNVTQNYSGQFNSICQ